MSLNSKTITYQDSQGTKLEGYAAWKSDATGKLPGVLVAHTAIGRQEEFINDKVERLAQLGYVGFALDMFGAGKLVEGEEKDKYNGELKGNRNLIADRAQAALKALQQMDQVQEDRTAAIGYCLGGKVVIDLARTNPSGLKGVVSYHGILDRHDPDEASNFGARVFAFHGSADPLITPEMYTGFLKEMEERKVDCDVVTFVGCRHSFTRPDKRVGNEIAQYSENADKRSWEQTVKFLAEILS